MGAAGYSAAQKYWTGKTVTPRRRPAKLERPRHGGAVELGLFKRLSALALLGMTLVIQVFVYPSALPTHLTWAVALMYLAGRGPGRFSLDRSLRLG